MEFLMLDPVATETYASYYQERALRVAAHVRLLYTIRKKLPLHQRVVRHLAYWFGAHLVVWGNALQRGQQEVPGSPGIRMLVR